MTTASAAPAAPAANPTNLARIPSVSIVTARTGASGQPDALGMRTMQVRAYARRGEQYLLIKSPPASGKSRALMFIALDKLNHQGVRQAIVVVPERSIGGSFADEPLSHHGFEADWHVEPRWNLCNAPGGDDGRAAAKSKVQAVRQFLGSTDRVLVCTHATFRFAFDELGVEAFDDRLIAIDEFHHVSSNPDNRLGSQLGALIGRGSAHVVAMTGSYFRGDSEAVLSPHDEARFETVTYTYYEQLNGYRWLKALDIGYFFYTGPYVDAVNRVLDPMLKTIVHIPNVNARESLKDKQREVDEIMQHLGEWLGVDEVTGFHRVRGADGRVLKVADLVDDSDAARRSRVLAALKDPAHKLDRDHVDVIVALGMAKEGFDWIWCEHALTIGYRSSLTEIVQIIGRATRDAPGKERARFTNLIAEPTAEQGLVAEAVNDMLKAISASLLMEQVLAPRYAFTPKGAGPQEGFTYGPDGYREGATNVGINGTTGEYHIEIKGLATPRSPEARRICREDLNEVITGFLQDRTALERGLFTPDDTVPEDLTQLRMGRIVRERYPDLTEEDHEAIRQHAVAVMNVTQQGKLHVPGAAAAGDAAGDAAAGGAAGGGHADGAGAAGDAGAGGAEDRTTDGPAGDSGSGRGATGGGRGAADDTGNTSLLDGVRRFVNVRDLDIDLIDRINPFAAAYSVLARAMDADLLKQVQGAISSKKSAISEDEARDLGRRAVEFKRERGRLPAIDAADPWERRMAEGVNALARIARQRKAAQAANAAQQPGGGADAHD